MTNFNFCAEIMTQTCYEVLDDLWVNYGLINQYCVSEAVHSVVPQIWPSSKQTAIRVKAKKKVKRLEFLAVCLQQ